MKGPAKTPTRGCLEIPCWADRTARREAKTPRKALDIPRQGWALPGIGGGESRKGSQECRPGEKERAVMLKEATLFNKLNNMASLNIEYVERRQKGLAPYVEPRIPHHQFWATVIPRPISTASRAARPSATGQPLLPSLNDHPPPPQGGKQQPQTRKAPAQKTQGQRNQLRPPSAR